MQGSKTDSFQKTQKNQRRFDDGTGKRATNKKRGHGQYRDKRQDQ